MLHIFGSRVVATSLGFDAALIMDEHPNREQHLSAHSRDLFRGSAVAAIVKIAITLVGFGFNLVLARRLGVEQTGVYFLAFALITVASVLSKRGLDGAALKYASRHIALSDWVAVKTTYLSAVRTVGLTSAVFSVVFVTCGQLIAKFVFGKPDLAEVIPVMALGIIPLAMLHLHAQLLKSARYIGTSLFLQNGSISLAILAALLLFPGIDSARDAAVTYVVAALAVFALIVFLWLNISRFNHFATDWAIDRAELHSSSNSLYIVSMVNQIILPWSALILLGIWGTQEEAGQFGIARRLAMLINFAYLAVESITGPKFAGLFAVNDLQAVRFVAGRATLLISLVATPVGVLFFVFPEWILGWFGPGFSGAVTVLVVMSAGQLVNALTGSVASLLVMSGHEKDYRNVTVVAGIVNLALGLLLIPYWGAEGAAWATAIAVGGLNLLGLVIVRRRLGFLPFPGLTSSDRS